MSFTSLFYKHIMFRHSCGKCHYCNTRRPSDITLADFWGWEKTDPNINADNKGVSLVFVNTDKGAKLFDAVRGRMDVIPAKLEDCIQPNMQHPTIINPKRTAFEKDYAKHGFKFVLSKYEGLGIWKYVNKITKMLSKTK